MSASVGPNLGINHSWAARESGWNVGMDANLKKLDSVVQLMVKDKDLATPPGSPAEGDRYIVGTGPSGAWAGHAKDVAVYLGAAWVFYTPGDGWIAWVTDENQLYVYNSSAWEKFARYPGAGVTVWKEVTPADFGAATKVVRGTGAVVIDYSGTADNENYAHVMAPNDIQFDSALIGINLWFASGGTAGTNTVWRAGIAYEGDTLSIADAFTYGASTVIQAPNVANKIVISPVGLGIPAGFTFAAGDYFKLAIQRQATHASDVNTDTMYLVAVELLFSHAY